jgi:hypothetical protein
MVTFLDLGKMGRLGNQMFQIASTIGVALQNGKDFSFPDWVCRHSSNSYVDLFIKKLPKLEINKNIININETNFSYDEILLPNDNNIYSLKGYFQSEKYFKDYKNVINEYFTLKPEINNSILEKYQDILKNSCSLHIRRGDYLHQTKHHPTQDLKYYYDSINLLYGNNLENTNLLIFSDDIGWCKKNINIQGTNIHFIEGNLNIVDMFLMSLCDNNIIANSSFSWWGAWLNKNDNKTVVAPKNWFGPHNSHLPTKDLFCESWIVL